MHISVIVPVYNTDRYLRQCVDSIMSQTMPAYEIILIDDGSQDKSGKICDEYARIDERIKVVHKQNAGLGMARNTGLENVNGDYVTFVDSDDFLDNDFIEKSTKTLQQYNCDTCKSTFRRVDLNGEYISQELLDQEIFCEDSIRNKLLPRMIGSAPDKKDSIPMSVCCSIFSMKIIKNHNLCFVSEREWISEDILFNLAYYSYSKRCCVLNYIGYNYRVNINSLTTKYIPQRFEMCMTLYNKELEELNRLGIYKYCKYRLDRQLFVYLRMCIEQLNASGLIKSNRISEISKICENSIVQKIISEYPKSHLGIAQRTFLFLLRHKATRILNWYFS